MPFPWKKGSKRTRISQLVAGHLKSPKRGGSLVVETGFPTSLIDLFVKNRDRLKKKKKTRYDASDPIQNQPSTPFESFPASPRSSVSGDEFKNAKQSPFRDLNIPSALGVGDEIEGGGGGEVADANGVFMAVLKISLVVVLALGTKRFAVGITMSAFLLIFLEFAGKHGCKLSKPCASVQKRLNSLIQSVLWFFRIGGEKFVKKEEEEIRVLKAPIEQETIVFHELSDSNEEFIVLQSNSVLVPPIVEIQCVKDDFEGERKGGFEELDTKKEITKKEEDRVGDVSDKQQRSRSAKIKSKMKKLVPKKFRVSKKKGQDLKIEERICMADDVLVVSEVQEPEECGDELSLLSSALCDQEDGDDVISNSTEVSRIEVEKETEKNSGTERNLWYLILVLTVLVGLVGGRVMALVLTVSSCFMLKSARALWRSEKMPLFRSPTKKSTCTLEYPCL
ncbi:uncharacterized protein LOC132313354 [Cornus florida]|uniref:uncharacterized protein LOC132313354 n=1 Tax=Cornus florida TaxID=4283 RepID=UPI002896BD16|nr:uncharacterized protein LOC132313354 [Cornus florida]